jgi:carboxylate-amine ligase
LDLADPATWKLAFSEPATLSVGIEEEVMVLDADSLDLAPEGPALAAALNDHRFKTELPAAQLELVTAPAESVPDAVSELAGLRCRAAGLARERGLALAGAGVHPFADPSGKLNSQPRYSSLEAEFGALARRQLVFGLHVHVCIRGMERALAVYNALREHLPLIAALAANGPLYAGADSGLASVRPKLSTLLPRQGVPPAFSSWQHVADTYRFGQASGAVPDLASWWWEARLHPQWGTIEVRVPDAQTLIGETAAVAAVIHALLAWLSARHGADDLPSPAEAWRIEENRWSACRWGVHGTMADLRSGERRQTEELIECLLDELSPAAKELGCEQQLAGARELVLRAPSDRLRALAAGGCVRDVVASLAARFDATASG